MARSSVWVKDFVSKKDKGRFLLNLVCLDFLQPTLRSVHKDYILWSCTYRKAWLTRRCSTYTDNGPCLWRAAALALFFSPMKNWGSESMLWKGPLESKPCLLCSPACLTGFQLILTGQSGLQRVCRLLNLIYPVTHLFSCQCLPQFTHKKTELQQGYMYRK